MKSPKTFSEWRWLWHSLHDAVGGATIRQFERGEPIRITPEMYRTIRRAARVKLRMEVEAEAFTTSYASALLEMVFRDSDAKKST